jgi:phosphatidylserine/phosphatidylglycerophosphate/cardiolipin synthase-like enzyme
MALSNPRFLIDGVVATSFVYGRSAELAVDVQNFAGGIITFKLWKTATAPPLVTQSVAVGPVGSTASTLKVLVSLNYQWQFLRSFPGTFSMYNVCCDAGSTQPYPTNASFLSTSITDDLLYPPLYFTANELGQAPVTSPTIRRQTPQLVPGNVVDLFVNGDEIQAAVLEAIGSAQKNVHLDWFFFDTKSKISTALQDCLDRGVEVRLLFDIPLTTVPEPFGQGLNVIDFGDGLAELVEAGVEVASSSHLVAPIDNLTTVTDPEYADRLAIQKAYAESLIVASGLILYNTIRNYTTLDLIPKLPKLFTDAGRSLSDLGTAGIGTPVLLGGCRDHTKLVIVDGKVAFCGGANQQKFYLYDNPISPTRDATEEMNDAANTEKWQKWHDCFVRVAGPAVATAQRYFIERWAVCKGKYLSRTDPGYFPAVPATGTAAVKFVANVPGLERDIAAEYLRLFRNASQSIHVENPYVTDDLIATFMAQAAQVRHLPVELIVPDKYLDFAIARDLMKARWDALRAAGIEIYAYNTHMLHVKVATADGLRSIVSSYNFAKSSADQLFEFGAVIEDAAFATEVKQRLFDVDRPAAERVTTSTAPDWTAPHPEMRFADRIV